MDGPKLVKMANQIAAFFAAEPDPKAASAGLAGHLKRFWEPRMRRQIFGVLDAGGDSGMSESVVAALKEHRQLLEPVAK